MMESLYIRAALSLSRSRRTGGKRAALLCSAFDFVE